MIASLLVLSILSVIVKPQAVETVVEAAPVWNRLPYDRVDLGSIYDVLNVGNTAELTDCKSIFLNSNVSAATIKILDSNP